MIKAVIFDMDGVIAETEAAHIKAEKETMLRYGVKVTSTELQRYTGTTAKFMIGDLIKRYKLDVSFEKIFAQKNTALFKILRKKILPVKGVLNLIKQLQKRGLRLAVASSSHHKLINFILKKFKIFKAFGAIISGEDVVKSKPNPTIFLKAAHKLGVDPQECLVIEDAALGVQAAKAAGMRCVGYINPHSGNQDLGKADLITKSLHATRFRELL